MIKKYIDKIKTVKADSSQPSNVVDKVKKTVYDNLVIKFNAIKIPSASRLVFKYQYDSDTQNPKTNIEDVDKKVPYTSEVIKKIDYNTIITEIENKKPCITGLINTVTLNAKDIEIENKISDITNLATKELTY